MAPEGWAEPAVLAWAEPGAPAASGRACALTPSPPTDDGEEGVFVATMAVVEP